MRKICLLSAAALTLLPQFAVAHGTMLVPISRVYNCFKENPENPSSAACKAVVQISGTQPLYDWNEINQNSNGDHRAFVPDGQLCSGGRKKYAGLDQARNDWVASPMVVPASGAFTFVYAATAPHATRYFKFYITKDGWNPNLGLKWGDLEEFATVSNPGPAVDKRYTMTVKMPTGKKGRQVIYSVWQRSDSPETFYSCSDVSFSGDSVPPPTVSWEEKGALIANGNLAAGSTVTFRVFDPQGSDAARLALKLDAASGRAAQWPLALAQKVNAESAIFKIGVLQSQGGVVSVVPVASASANRVYLSKAYPNYHYQVDKDTPTTPPQPGAGQWVEGAAYAAGQIVSFGGKRYKCLQPHTAHVGANWRPDVSPALWQPA
ncbi:lytic polysaccharide monooxygenase [Janthinobacterium fluminis]|uniref:Lytic polysaccharide monooxygenase n=1 Tax=Janthinobacterium fluminis TaxID=2987524 RepID=A0ABT5K553_9BURK|nr:lytic polysaccharide monooxygenase [Janthinobacterium fluminis]MDC8759221.1 lytic polysaccharide monooxygenase [Janthinobacterium fluminis]